MSDDDGRQSCSRGDWCAERTVTSENGTRTVTPARTYRAFCDGCSDFLLACLTDHDNGLPALYGRLAKEIGETRQAEVMVKIPFGPSVPLSEAIDAHQREMADTMCSWEIRVRDVGHLSDLGEKGDRPQDRASDLERSVSIIAPHRLTALLSLPPEPMVRVLPWWALPDDAEIVTGDGVMVKVVTELGGMHAGMEIMQLHYYARRLLLETNPPQPLLPDFRCRICERKALRRAAPPWHESAIWYRSRCDACGDEMTADEYAINGQRWIAYERAHLATPKLAALAPQIGEVVRVHVVLQFGDLLTGCVDLGVDAPDLLLEPPDPRVVFRGGRSRAARPYPPEPPDVVVEFGDLCTVVAGQRGLLVDAGQQAEDLLQLQLDRRVGVRHA